MKLGISWRLWQAAAMYKPVGTRIIVSGGYDFEPAWLAGEQRVVGQIVKWIPTKSAAGACVIKMDLPLTAMGRRNGRPWQSTGGYLVLQLRSPGQDWGNAGFVQVELCEAEPQDELWPQHTGKILLESHASYRFLT